MKNTQTQLSSPHVVIIGGGFAGLYAAKSLKKAPVKVTLIDKRNFHLFQPLLYQVATGSLSPADIASPLRVILSQNKKHSSFIRSSHRYRSSATKNISARTTRTTI
jgi:NADH dehydrogenase